MLNWREVPFFRILIPFIFGILASMYWNLSFPIFNYLLFFFAFLLGLTAFFKIKFRWQIISGLLLNLFFILFGHQLTFFHNDWNSSDHFRKHLLKENLVVGQVSNVPKYNERSIQVNLEVQQLGKNKNSLNNCSGKITLWVRNDTVNQQMNYGDLLIFRARINPIQPNLNPEAFDFKKYLSYKNIHYQAYVKSNDWKKLKTGNGNPILSWAFKTRMSLIKILKRKLSSENEFAVASALILGYKNDLSDELKNAYANTGAMHVLAVSGLHAGLIWGILAFFLNWIRWKHPAWRWIKTGITIAGLWVFALITGASPSVLRAATMFSFLLIGIALNRNTNIYNTLAASAFCLCLFNPYLLVEVGFQLSYFAVIGIVYFYKKIYGLWYIENRIGDYLWRLSAVAIAAQLSTFPLTMYYFHQFPVYFLFSGLIVVPFAFLILGLGISLFLTDWILPILGTAFSKILLLVIWFMNAMIFFIEQLPSDFLKDIWIGYETMLLFYCMIISVVIALNTKQFKYMIIGLVFLLLNVVNSSIQAFKNYDQKLIVVYHLKDKTHVNFISGNSLISFGDPNIKKKTLDFATRNFHLKHSIEEEKKFYFLDKDSIVNDWFLHDNLIQFFDKKIAFVGKLPENIPDKKLKVDFVLIKNDFKDKVEDINRFYEFDKIILDGALPDFARRKIKKECLELNVSTYDSNHEGAFVFDINKKGIK